MSEFNAESTNATDGERSTRTCRVAKNRSDAQWFELFEAWQKSGMSINGFARHIGMHPSVFYRAYQRLGDQWMRGSGTQESTVSASRGDFIEVRADSATSDDSASNERRSPSFSGVEIITQGAARVALSCDFDRRTLRRVLETIAELYVSGEANGDRTSMDQSSSPQKIQPSGSPHGAQAVTGRRRKDGGPRC